jgi:putative transposase
MPRTLLRDDPWERIKDLRPGHATDCGVTAKDHRLCIEAGCGWRGPAGRGATSRQREGTGMRRIRASRGGKQGVWQRILAAICHDAGPGPE